MVSNKDGIGDGDDRETLAGRRLERHYRNHASWLGRILRSRFGAAADEAEDLVQEAYLRIARYADDDRDRHPRALLLAIARNLLRDHRRSAAWRYGSQTQRPVELGEILPAEPDQAEQLLLKQIILGMPAIYRDVFLLSRFSAMTYEEIAHHLGISVKTVEWRMARALEHCSAQLRV